MGWFKPKQPGCRHVWSESVFIWNGTTNGAQVGVCSKCGDDLLRITPAGYQQIGWWMEAGCSREEAKRRVLAGDYPSWVWGGGAA